MATRLTIAIQSRSGEGSDSFLVEEDFDQVLEKMAPLSPPTSQLQGRELCVWNLSGGGRLWCHPQHIIWAEENAEE